MMTWSTLMAKWPYKIVQCDEARRRARSHARGVANRQCKVGHRYRFPPFIVINKIKNDKIKSRGQSWRSGSECDCTTDWLWVQSPLEKMKYLFKFIFPFLRSGVKAKRGVEFRHSIRNAFRIRQKVENRVFQR